MKILIDNGHGRETLGKRSPDGSLREHKWARESLPPRTGSQTERSRRRENRQGGERRLPRRTLPTSELYLSEARNSERNPRINPLQRRSSERQQVAQRPRLERVDVGRKDESGRPRHGDMGRNELPTVGIQSDILRRRESEAYAGGLFGRRPRF